MKLSKVLLSFLFALVLIVSVVESQAVDTATAEAAEASEATDSKNAADGSTVKAEENVTEETKTDPEPKESETSKPNETKAEAPPVQAGPLVDLLGPTLLSLELIDEKSAKIKDHLTNDALRGKKVIGLYFSADW